MDPPTVLSAAHQSPGCHSDTTPALCLPHQAPSLSSASVRSSSSAAAPAPQLQLDEVQKPLTCGICNCLVASSLVLSCGHTFCGCCLFVALNDKAACPTCKVGLRAIPVRCLALDGVVEAFVDKLLHTSEHAAYTARVEEGRSAANKINKMFWWLQPAAIPALGGDSSVPVPCPNGRGRTMLPQQRLQPRRSLDYVLGGPVDPSSCGSFTGGSFTGGCGSRPQQLQFDGPYHGSNSFTGGSSGLAQPPPPHRPPPRPPSHSCGGAVPFQQHLQGMQQMDSLRQLAALSMPSLQQQQQPMLPPSYLDYASMGCQQQQPGSSHMAQLQAQAQLQQLLQNLYMQGDPYMGQ